MGKFLLEHWYDIGGVLIIPTLLWAWLGHPSTVQLILALNLAVIFWHQVEEYRFPGGEPWILNEVMMPKQGVQPDRLPTNELSGIWINVTGWFLYLIPVFFPHQVWLGLAPILFGFPAQFIAHGIVTTRKLRFFYNPGLAAVVCGHLPLAVWYFVEVYSQNLIHWWDWIAGIGLLGFFIGFVFLLVGFRILAPRGAEKHPYTPDEFNRWDRQRRLRRAGITPRAISTHPTAAGQGR